MNTVDIKTVTEKGNDPAYPTLLYDDNSGRPTGHRLGLTKREMFAMAAMQGIMGNPSANPTGEVHFHNIAEDAVKIADELLKQLES